MGSVEQGAQVAVVPEPILPSTTLPKSEAEFWLVKRRLEDLGTMFRTCWDLYIKFYTVFLTFSVAAMGYILQLHTNPQAKLVPVLALVFMGQCLLTAITSAFLGFYSGWVAADYDILENGLVGSSRRAELVKAKPIPLSLARWSAYANSAAMVAMAAVWLYIGFVR